MLLSFYTAFISIFVCIIAGFGTSTLFLPIALIFVDFKSALVLVAITHLAGNTGTATFFRQVLDKRLILLFGVPSVILTVLGAYIITYISQKYFNSPIGNSITYILHLFLQKP